jgi:hypothetical protein
MQFACIILYFHFQAVCDSDTLKTPRVMSPVTRNIGGATRKVPNTSHNKPHHTPNINEIIYGKDRHTAPTGPLSRELDHTLRKYGSSSFNVYGTRGQHDTRETENVSPTSPRQTVSRTSSVSSAARTRKTLNSLLNDNISPIPSSRPIGSRKTSDSREAAGSFVGLPSSRKNGTTVNNLVRKTAQPSISSSRVPGAGSKRSGVYSSLQMHDLHSSLNYTIPDFSRNLFLVNMNHWKHWYFCKYRCKENKYWSQSTRPFWSWTGSW